jgi:hypothetical protein
MFKCRYKLTPELHDVGKIGMTLVAAAFEGAKLLCAIVSDTGTGTIITPKVPYHILVPVPEVDQTVSSNAY